MSWLPNGSEGARHKLASEPLNKTHGDPHGPVHAFSFPIIGRCQGDTVKQHRKVRKKVQREGEQRGKHGISRNKEA